VRAADTGLSLKCLLCSLKWRTLALDKAAIGRQAG
jgi:hypothetical protein